MFLKIVSKNLIFLNEIILSKIDICEIKIDVQLIFKEHLENFSKELKKFFACGATNAPAAPVSPSASALSKTKVIPRHQDKNND